MKGLKVKCPNCGRTDFITTDKFNPDVRPNGGMVKCTLPYYIDWLTTSSTVCAEMTCPECLAQLAPSGVLNVLVPIRECGQFFAEEQEIADLETEMKVIEEALCSGTLSVDELTEKSKRLPELSDLIDEKTLRWLELSEIESY